MTRGWGGGVRGRHATLRADAADVAGEVVAAGGAAAGARRAWAAEAEYAAGEGERGGEGGEAPEGDDEDCVEGAAGAVAALVPSEAGVLGAPEGVARRAAHEQRPVERAAGWVVLEAGAVERLGVGGPVGPEEADLEGALGGVDGKPAAGVGPMDAVTDPMAA